jgi:hypothetical protein
MAGRRDDSDRGYCCDQADAGCAGVAVSRLSRERVRELAEEIWTASTGRAVRAWSGGDPRDSRAGASAEAAYRRGRGEERTAWRARLRQRVWMPPVAALASGIVVTATTAAWIGWPVALGILLLGTWRLRFRASGRTRTWRRRAVLQRRTARLLGALVHDGYLVLHDVTLPSWPGSLDHLVIGPTGAWAVESRRRARPWHAGEQRRSQAAAIAGALAGEAGVTIRSLLCVHGHGWPARRAQVDAGLVTSPRRLVAVLRDGPRQRREDVERVTSYALAMLRPAA